ncbi:glycoside hydrolase family 75 protein [Amycolatopsis sp. EV170708-02-1]|uniref:glycoside hydrolase family 75 protein n=1 Tax=Amycolatopsis sp. EV170708-02-1 TaxID=2919322 RepID=UPI001F0B802E|nr:glycoside hydrolase family 75 protein [Amycolatopsis sp. EV170708-02-1]UMP02289.1 glycoside hydrolase family 75 protein [Amycolatopsis sp. EV170708-02-1]
MRKLLLFSAMVVAAGLAPAATAAASVQAGPTAQQLLAKTTSCKQVSNGKYKTDEETGRTIAVCDAGSAVFWKADMDVDCDGQPTARCNKNTDPWFQDGTAYPRSDGKALVADETPYIVVPSISSTWNFEKAGLKGAGSCAVIYNNKVLYTVIGDTGPKDIIGEASYATAKALGINPDPKNGGVDSGVTYICFKNSKVSPIENHGKATSVGEGLAAKFVQG